MGRKNHRMLPLVTEVADAVIKASAALLRELTDMRFWTKSLRIFKCLCDQGTQSVRRIAQKTGCSKSSVHRLKQAMERRDIHPESWLWETAEGRCWLIRLFVATLYSFGLKRGVGVETMSEFFTRLRLDTQVGISPCALRGVMQALEATILETIQGWEQEGTGSGEVREIIGAVDETFLERMMVVFQDLPTGYLVLEDVADDRTFATWHALVDVRLKALGTEVLYLVSDRAKALIQLAEQGLMCLSMPDFLALVPCDVIRSQAQYFWTWMAVKSHDAPQRNSLFVRGRT